MTAEARGALGEPGVPGDVPPRRRPEEDRERILRERAAAVARVREEPRAAGLSVLAFALGGERYAVEVKAVLEVVDASGLSPLPAAPPWVLGAVLARSRVVPVLDLRALLGLEAGGLCDLSKIIVLEDEGELFGLAVEELAGQLDLDQGSLAPAGEGPIAFLASDRLAVLSPSRLDAPASRGS